MRNWRPFIADAVREIARQRRRRIVGIPLAPQFSTLSVQKYMDAAQAALPAGMEFSCVRSFHDHPLLIEAFAEKVRAAVAAGGRGCRLHRAQPAAARGGRPATRIRTRSPSTAKAVADRCGIHVVPHAYQSAGRTPEPWLGPDLSD